MGAVDPANVRVGVKVDARQRIASAVSEAEVRFPDGLVEDPVAAQLVPVDTGSQARPSGLVESVVSMIP